MDLATALAISARSMEVQATRLRAVAETLIEGDVTAGVPFTGSGRCDDLVAWPGTSWPGTSWPCPPVDLPADLAANLDTLRAARALLGRTVGALR